jgi:DNA-binding transcriptional LysR family regulator
MRRYSMNELASFAVVAREKSFTRAAAQLGVSTSALSQTIRTLEEILGLRLLTRTTRSVSLTEAGQRLLETVAPRFDDIHAELAQLSALRDRPAGTVRITASEYAVERVLWPGLAPVLRAYPEINLELSIDHGFGESVEKDMVAMRIAPDGRLVAVATPAYFAQNPPPLSPKDLTTHRCINLRMVSSGAVYAWEFQKNGQDLRVRVGGQVTFNSVNACLKAVLDGFGIGFLPEAAVQPLLASGALLLVLDDWSQPISGLHLYYPTRHISPACRMSSTRCAIGNTVDPFRKDATQTSPRSGIIFRPSERVLHW